MKWLKKLWAMPLTVGGWITIMLISDYFIKPFWQAIVNWIILNWWGLK